MESSAQFTKYQLKSIIIVNDASKTKALRVYDTREDMFGLCRVLSMEEEVIIFQLKCEVRRIVEDILS